MTATTEIMTAEKPAVRFLRIMLELNKLMLKHTRRVTTAGHAHTVGTCLYCYAEGAHAFHHDQTRREGFFADALPILHEEGLEDAFMSAFQERLVTVLMIRKSTLDHCSVYSDDWFLNWLAENV